MRLVGKPEIRPNRCAALAYMGQTADTRWVDTGSELPGFDNHVYLSEPAVIEAARVLGLPTQEEYTQARARIQELEEHVKKLLDLYETARRQVMAIETLDASGMRIKKKVGRPAVEEPPIPLESING